MLRFDARSPDGRTLELCIVPYSIATEVADGLESEPYRELFRPGAFREQVEEAQSAPLRINLNKKYRHGIGTAHARDHTSGGPVTTFLRSDRLYRIAMSYNRGLDRDHDGIACESA